MLAQDIPLQWSAEGVPTSETWEDIENGHGKMLPRWDKSIGGV